MCTDGCKERRTGDFCNYYNLAYDSSVLINPNSSYPGSLANDGSKTSCSKTNGPTVTFQVDLKEESIVTGLHILFGELTTKVGSHTLYASNTSNNFKTGTMVYEGQFLPTRINVRAVFRYLTYVPPVHGKSSVLEVCEIGIIGCPPSRYGPVCNKLCPGNCNGPCDLATGSCAFGCLNRWTGDKCEQECSFGQFGKNCSEFCHGCISQMCDHVNGICDNSTACKPGYVYDKYCNTSCSDGLYGSNCLHTCSPFCLHVPCDRRTGECIGGCIRGLHGFNCMQVSINTKKSDDDEVTTWIGIFIGGVLLGILITVVVCFVIRKKLPKKQSKDNVPKKTQSHDQQHYDDVGIENVTSYQDLRKDNLRKDTGANEYDQINATYVNQ
ncbi:Hypothetical predicted protein [Mytilus galloprovincialis]|uniref:Uncharacterized protein n=1 Tax=Mytilus galloprovincialis TaxID=29158 RepID=A0A8B6DE65_MYTGA|nr:Hypothetical predicted protein [Mytilus galloprovincialis]